MDSYCCYSLRQSNNMCPSIFYNFVIKYFRFQNGKKTTDKSKRIKNNHICDYFNPQIGTEYRNIL